MKNIKEILMVVSIILCCWLLVGVRYCYMQDKPRKDTISVVTDSIHDTVYIHKIDTVPVVKTAKIVKYVPIKEVITVLDSTKAAEQADSVLPIVQKEYSDDSTYTAYVSGIQYEDYPKLDSIDVRSRIITETITKTITIQKKRSRFSVGLQGGYGYGFMYKGFEPYVGVGVSFRIF